MTVPLSKCSRVTLLITGSRVLPEIQVRLTDLEPARDILVDFENQNDTDASPGLGSLPCSLVFADLCTISNNAAVTSPGSMSILCGAGLLLPPTSSCLLFFSLAKEGAWQHLESHGYGASRRRKLPFPCRTNNFLGMCCLRAGLHNLPKGFRWPSRSVECVFLYIFPESPKILWQATGCAGLL